MLRWPLKPLTIAVAGAGIIGRRHVELIDASPLCTLVALVDPAPAAFADVDRSDPLAHQLAHFCAVIRGEAKPLVSARDGLQNLRITEAIAEAARTGRVISTQHLGEAA